MAISYLKSCCDSSVTFILTDLGSSLPLGNVYNAQIPNYFTGCSEVVSAVLPGAPAYSSVGSTLTNFASCPSCLTTNPCIRITATSECDIVTKFPMGIECSSNIGASTITINVTGGTPPYKIIWANGVQGPVLSNAVPGISYSVTVTDYSWPGGPDYTATTVCTLAPPTPTPSVTPTPTPSSGGVNTTFLCLQVTKGSDTYTYNFTPSSTKINNKFTWNYGIYQLSWQLSPTPSWQVSMPIVASPPNVLFYNTNPSSPLGTFTPLGDSIRSAVMTNGVCGNPIMTLSNTTITAPICENTPNTGSLYVNTLNGQPTILYSLNGGATTQLNPLFINLTSGSYTVWVQDGDSTTLTQTVTIPVAGESANYSLDLNSNIVPLGANSRRLDFTVIIRDENGNQVTTLPTGTQISFVIIENNIFNITTQGGGNQVKVITVRKNSVTQNLTFNDSTLTSTESALKTCGPNTTKYTTATTRVYQAITITGSDVITGSVQIQLIKTSPSNVCIFNVQDTISLSNPQITNCSCCGINGTIPIVSMTSNYGVG